MDGKGFPQIRECLIFEVCHPRQADRVLGEDFRMNLALPCRISVWEEKQGTQIGMILPPALLAQLSDSPGLRAIAAEVEAEMKRIIDEAT